MQIIISLLGIVVLLGIMYLLSSDRKNIPYKTIIKALVIQFIIAFLLIRFPIGQVIVEKISDVVTQILSYGS